MADPVVYNPAYNFAAFQADSPADPLPADQLDTALADIAASTESLVNAVKDVRRADGALKNGVVTLDSLSVAVSNGLGPTAVQAALDAEAALAAADLVAAQVVVDRAATLAFKNTASAAADTSTANAALTAADKATVAADKIVVAADKATVAADKIVVAADKVIVIADMGTVAADKAVVAADKATVAADKVIVAADKGTVAADKVIVAADKGTVAADKVATAADRVQTGLDRTAAADSAAAAASAGGGATIFIGAWDASAGTFPGGGTAQKGSYYSVSVAGTVGGILFDIGDQILAIVNNASTATYAANWIRAQGTVSLADITGALGYTPATAAQGTKADSALQSADLGVSVQGYSAKTSAIAALTWAADRFVYFTGTGTAAIATVTSVARTLMAQTTQALMRTTGLGLTATGDAIATAANAAAVRTTLGLPATDPFSKSYTSSQQVTTALGTLTLAHGLGAVPKLISVHLICLTAESGYSVNDEVVIAYADANASNGAGITIDATNIYVKMSTVAFLCVNKSDGTRGDCTPANWRAVYKAWA